MPEQMIELKLIKDNPFQDRDVYLDIEGLGRTIAMHDLQERPKARSVNGHFELKFGHRRMRAFEWLSKNWKKEGLPERYSGYTVMPMEVEEISDADMFDGVVIENVHRDDLKVTEKARLLRRYKELHPEATSEQIGLVFNMNAATVRGMDIFLDLPEAVQSKLDDGTITMGTARMLHSMQKIASEKVIIETVKAIEKNKGNAVPEEVIDDGINQLDDSVDMWNDGHREGKPRAGYHGWLLDMKNFPNDLLPTLDVKITKTLTAEQIEHLNNPPACISCPFYTKIRGSHYCGVKLCHERKFAAWQAYQVQDASKKLGVPIYAETDGLFRVLDSFKDKPLFTKNDQGLRLISKGRVDGYHNQWGFDGVDDDLMLVVATGEALAKMRVASGRSATGKKTDKEKAEMRAMKIYRQRRKGMMWECTGVGQAMFEGVPEKVIERMRSWHYVCIDDAIPDEYKRGNEKGEYVRRALVWTFIHDKSSHYRRQTMAAIVKDFQLMTGIKPTKSLLKRAEEWDAEINAAAKVSVAVETKGKK